jgi:septal ring factor EnvC (AmiA/AmiB activator)
VPRSTPRPSRAGRAVATRLRRAVALAVAALLVTLGTLPAGAADLEAAKQRRAELQEDRAALASELDVLTADRDEVVAALDALEAHAAAEQAALATATAEASDAFAAAGRARVSESKISVRLRERTTQLQDLAVEAYIGDPGVAGELGALVRARSVGDAAKGAFLVDLEVERQDAIAAELVRLQAAREVAREVTAAASSDAAARREEVAARVVAVEEARDRQAAFVATVEEQLERRLAEAAGLEALDADLAAEIVEGERVLAERLAAEAAARSAAERARAADAAARAADAAASAGGDGDHLDADGAAAPPSGRVVAVGGIQVDASLAEPLAALLAAAQADGVQLGGGGFRDRAAQIARRLDNCGASHHDLYIRAASSCAPPTARPGHSMHERGLAIDFTYQGALIGTRANPGYLWLSVNAGRFGLRNLPSEPWHWSTTGA